MFEFPLFVFTTFAGLAAGAYIASAVFPEKGKRVVWAFPLMCLLLLAVGLLGCLAHLARPELFLNALINCFAGIAQEAYFAIAFGIVLVVDLILTRFKGLASHPLRIVGAIIAFGLTCVMGLAYVSILGSAAWCTWVTVPLFVVGDILIGFTIYALFLDQPYQKPAFFGTVLVAAVVFVLVLAGEALHFVGIELSPMPFVAAMVVTLFSGVLVCYARKHDNTAVTVSIFVVACMGVCIARWAFYAASII